MPLFSGFETVRTVPITLPDYTPVAQDVMNHFRQKGYEVTSIHKADGGWRVDITRGGIFHNIAGLRTALNIEIDRVGDATRISASVGLFELQAVPTVLTVLVFPPLIIGQIVGLVQQEKLDNEAVDVAEQSLQRHAAPPAPPSSFAPGYDPITETPVTRE
ncbi:MAG: hypothetical protein RMJ43_07140 [Chloroherpetonaceae bacterium]|nr:hypothetical protein [Chloroherpetonaceae bacterium]